MTGASSSPDHVKDFLNKFASALDQQTTAKNPDPANRDFAEKLFKGISRLGALYNADGIDGVNKFLSSKDGAERLGLPKNTAEALRENMSDLAAGRLTSEQVARNIHSAVGADAKAHAHRFTSAHSAPAAQAATTRAMTPAAAHAASINAHEVPHAGAAAASPQPEHAQPTPQPANAARAQAAAHDEAAEKKRGRFNISKKNMIRIGVIGGAATIAWNMIFGTDKPSITVPTLPVELRASAMQEPVRNFMTHASAQMMQDLGKKDVREKLGLSEKEGIQIRVATTAPASDELIKAFKQNGAVDVSYPKGKLLEDKAVSIHYQKDRTDLTVGGVTHSMPTTALAQAMLADNPGKALQEQIKKANAAAGRRPGSAPGF